MGQFILKICAACSVLGLALSIFGNTSVALAAPLFSSNGNTVHHTETIRVSGKLCATLRQALPDKANDPNLCLFVHEETITEGSSVSSNLSVQPLDNWWSCYTGSKSFSDNYYGISAEFDLKLNTSWSWSGSCGVPPTLTSENCYLAYGIPWHETGKVCNDYTTSIPSRAAYYQSTLEAGVNGLGLYETVWQRRECYTGTTNGASNDGTCNWHTDLG